MTEANRWKYMKKIEALAKSVPHEDDEALRARTERLWTFYAGKQMHDGWTPEACLRDCKTQAKNKNRTPKVNQSK